MRSRDRNHEVTRRGRAKPDALERAYRRGVADGEAIADEREATTTARDETWPGRLDAALHAEPGVRENELTRVLTSARPGARLRVEAYDASRPNTKVTDVRAARRDDATWALTTRHDGVVVQSEINGARAVARALTRATASKTICRRVSAREPERVEPREGAPA